MRIFLTFILLFSSGAFALGKDDTRDGELAAYDRELNQTYQAILHELAPAQQAQLREAQRAWLKMRDADCGWSFVDIRDCQIDRTINRTKELKESLFTTKSGAYQSLDELPKKQQRPNNSFKADK